MRSRDPAAFCRFRTEILEEEDGVDAACLEDVGLSGSSKGLQPPGVETPVEDIGTIILKKPDLLLGAGERKARDAVDGWRGAVRKVLCQMRYIDRFIGAAEIPFVTRHDDVADAFETVVCQHDEIIVGAYPQCGGDACSCCAFG